MRKLRFQFRAWLPLVVGLISIALMARKLSIPGFSCDFYDIGWPDWHCEGPSLLLELLSAPAIFVADWLASFWRMAPAYFTYAIDLPLILLWWWFAGTRVDFGLLGVGGYKHRRAWMSFFIASLFLLLAYFGWSVWEGAQYYRLNSYPSPLLYSMRDVRSLPSRVWLLILILAFGMAALRLARGHAGQTDRKLASHRAMRMFAVGLLLYSVCAAGAVWHFRRAELRREAEYELRRILIQGRVLDDRGLPVNAIEVDLVPILENGEIQEHPIPAVQTANDFTNENGEYALSPLRAGRYVLSVQWNAPPSTSHPFLTRYYPDSSDLKHAETFEFTSGRHVVVEPIRLERVELAKVPVSASWSNGKLEPEAYFLFINTRYPDFGAVGNEALHPDSDGTVLLPVGFEYLAGAEVDCDGGARIESHDAPRLRFSLKSQKVESKPLRFVFPGNPCEVWHPK